VRALVIALLLVGAMAAATASVVAQTDVAGSTQGAASAQYGGLPTTPRGCDIRFAVHTKAEQDLAARHRSARSAQRARFAARLQRARAGGVSARRLRALRRALVRSEATLVARQKAALKRLQRRHVVDERGRGCARPG
jgi:hypothetical protein